MSPDYSFQEKAVNAVFSDFIKDHKSRNLLVIPTGGGKTVTAIKIIQKLKKTNNLNKNKRALWVTHRKQLKSQTAEYLNNPDKRNKFGFDLDLKDVLDIKMKKAGSEILESCRDEYVLIIIDEAHHSSAKTYEKFFNYDIGILGLTATPKRSDEKELDFDKVSYSITYRELAKRNVIKIPNFIIKKTSQTIRTNSISSPNTVNNDLNAFNYEERNKYIISEIFNGQDKFKKTVVFAGTVQHAKNLYKIAKKKNDNLKEKVYKHIGYIHGDGNEQNISNDEYLKKHKKMSSSLLFNCALLNEGYDDPSINTIVMATPTNSLLYYMQCIGRVMRPYESNYLDYVIEFFDTLPNISYRIDNDWLFADISDILQPEVITKSCEGQFQLKKEIKKIFRNHNVGKSYLNKIPKEDLQGISLLLFASNSKLKGCKWKPLFLFSKNRKKYTKIFNRISENAYNYSLKDNPDEIFKLLDINYKDDEYFKHKSFRRDFWTSLKRAYEEIENNNRKIRLKYFNFKKDYPEDFLSFIEGCYNKKELKRNYRKKEFIVRFPLILGGLEGAYLSAEQVDFCKEFYEKLVDIKNSNIPREYRKQTYNLELNLGRINIPMRILKNIPLFLTKGDKIRNNLYKFKNYEK